MFILYVGGLIVGFGVFIVLIVSLFVVVVGDMCICVGFFDLIVKGLVMVMIGGKLVVCMGDIIVYGGSIVFGVFIVMIGG